MHPSMQFTIENFQSTTEKDEGGILQVEIVAVVHFERFRFEIPTILASRIL